MERNRKACLYLLIDVFVEVWKGLLMEKREKFTSRMGFVIACISSGYWT